MSGTAASPLGLSAYGGYAATPGAEEQLMAMRMFPYRFAQSSGAGQSAMPATAMMPATATATNNMASLPAYDGGGVASDSAAPIQPTGLPSAASSSVIQSLIDLGLIAPGATANGNDQATAAPGR